MRLLNVSSLKLESLESFKIPPAYAILSHTWLDNQDDELTCQDIKDGTGKLKKGYDKIVACCTQAKSEGLSHVWIDTCCIDKTSSSELAEAINAMFKWYKHSKVCYAYLSDYILPEGGTINEPFFKESRWFTRGWTLQELIAPTKVVFYDQKWSNLGTKDDLSNIISEITHISQDILTGQDLNSSSIAQRMSWASERTTTRLEDMSYCLLGLFGVHMPMMYGEGGDAAFIRLQTAIMKKGYDHSLFAWTQQDNRPALAAHGMLATSPAQFKNASSLVPTKRTKLPREYGMTQLGLKIELPLTCTLEGGEYIALLACEEKESEQKLGIYLTSMNDGTFIRTRLNKLADEPTWLHKSYKEPILQSIYVSQLAQTSLSELPAQQLYHFEIVRYQDAGRDRYQDPAKRDIFFAERILRDNGSESSEQRDSSKISRLLDSISAKLLSKAYSLAIITSSDGPETMTFTLKTGGRVGVLYRGTTSPLKYTDWLALKRPPLICIIFGVSEDGTVFGQIDRDSNDQFRAWWKLEKKSRKLGLYERPYENDAREWFENYTLNRVPDPDGGNRNIELGRTTLYLAIVPKSVEGRSIHEVWLTVAGSDVVRRSII